MDWKILIFNLLGGLGIFLYGISSMGDSLKALAGNRMKKLIEKTTDTPIKGILTGTMVTVLLQSSSGTTALTVGLVSAGLMTLPQAVGVIFGANIGKVITPLLTAINISEYSLLIVAFGAIMLFFFPKKKIKMIGQCLFGFGLLFYGLGLMGSGMSSIITSDWAKNLFTTLGNNPILGLLTGTALTALIQSSSATIAMLQKLYLASSIEQTGLITISGALPILIGANIGTTITAVLASLSGKVSAKRAAFIHVLFNVFTAIIFMILLIPLSSLLEIIESKIILPLGGDEAMTLAIAHVLFNVGGVLALYWFINPFCKLATKIFKSKDDASDSSLLLGDESLIQKSPTMALELAKKAIDQMGAIASQFFKITAEYSFKNDPKLKEEGEKIEADIDIMDHNIHDYLIKITSCDLVLDEQQKLSKYLDTIRDLERIGDHCMNIIEFFDERYQANEVLSEEAVHDLGKMYHILGEMLSDSLLSLMNKDKGLAKTVAERENTIDRLEDRYRRRHILRINHGECAFQSVDNYVDILSNLERVGDHCNNIAGSVMSDVFYIEDDDDLKDLE